ncbi:MAG: CocE/NonD family hydrolase [Pseudomonadota bacterium]
MFAHDRYEDDIHHMGGCLITDTLEWGATLPSILALPPTPDSGDDWYDRWMTQLDHLCSPVQTWVREEARGTYWRHGSITHQTDRIRCPILAVGGWSDRYSNSVMSLVDACPDKAWGIVGPWGHHYPDHGHPGPAIGFQQVALEWWDHWLRPAEPDAPDWPKLRVWMREFDVPSDALDKRNGAWIESGPVADETQNYVLWLTQDSGLAPTPPKDQSAWTVPWDLSHGQASGDTGYFGRFGGLPLEQSGDDAKALVFETPALDQDVLLYGSADVTLTVQTPNDRAQICLRLNDVAPDGTSCRVGLSVLNLALDDTLDAPATPKGDGPQTVRPRFHSTAHRFKAGHRIRVSIASSYWPLVWTPPHQTDVKITAGQITLPVLKVAPKAMQTPFPAPRDLPAQKSFEPVATPRLTRSRDTETDGRMRTMWHQPRNSVRYNSIDTGFSFETCADHQIHPNDTNSACSVFIHQMAVERPDGIASVKSQLKAACDADHFVLDGHIEVFWAGTLVFERHWSDVINRRLS